MSADRASFFSVLHENIRDRLSGNQGRANARLGLVKPPAGQSRLIWIRAGATRDSVLLAAGLMAAIRRKRLDVRLVLTYEKEYPDVIVDQLSGMEKIGFGYACANNTSIEMRMLNRLNPFAIIFAGHPAGRGIVQALGKHPVKHLVNFQTTEVPYFKPEASYPTCNNTQHEYALEAMTLLMQSQVDAQLGALLKGSKQRELFLLVSYEASTEVSEILSAWQKSLLSDNNILCLYVAGQTDEINRSIKNLGLTVVKLSEWDRASSIEQQIVLLDEWRWFAATAASASAIHIFDMSPLNFWQSMASGSVITIAPTSELIANIELPQKNTHEILTYWENMTENTFQYRKLADDNRRQFWEYRRQAQEKIDHLLQRVYDW